MLFNLNYYFLKKKLMEIFKMRMEVGNLKKIENLNKRKNIEGGSGKGFCYIRVVER